MDPQVRNARYALEATIAGRSVRPEVVTLEIERPTLIVARAENAAAATTDRFDLKPAGESEVAVRYRSELRLKATLRMIGPLMVPALTRAWGNAVAGLEEALAPEWTPVEPHPRTHG